MLKDIVAQREEISVGDTSFSVGGMSITTIVSLCKEHMKEMNELFEGEVDVPSLLKEAPDFVAKVIAEAAGEPKQWKKVETLPAGIQIDALRKIWELTKISGEDLGNAIRGFGNVMEQVSRGYEESKQPLSDTLNSSPKPQNSSSESVIESEMS